MRVKRQLESILKIKADSFAKQDLAIFSAEVYKLENSGICLNRFDFQYD